MIGIEFIKYLSFLLLMHGECRGESLYGQLLVSQVVFERNMDIYDKKQFCFWNEDELKKVKFLLSNSDNKEKEKLSKKVYNKLSIFQIYYWSILYFNKDLLRIFNYQNNNYYMTINAYKVICRKYKKWSKSLEITQIHGNHIFLKDK